MAALHRKDTVYILHTLQPPIHLAHLDDIHFDSVVHATLPPSEILHAGWNDFCVNINVDAKDR